jgi:aryl-alcohol dehydrogenase-like predicted oxidoreductase
MRMTPLILGRDVVDEAEGIATIHEALDAGITILNTGDFYSMGLNEMLVGKAIRGRRDQAFISVKCGAMRSPSNAFLGFDMRPKSIKNFCAYSLQRLGVDVIDLYQPARVDPEVPLEDTIGAIAELVAEGKVRYIGVSEYNADQLRRAQEVHPIAALEIEYSLASRFIEAEILPTARELGVGIVAYAVVTQGLLTGSVTAELPAGDLRLAIPRFQGDNLIRNIAAVAALRDLASEHNATPAQIAIAWVMAQGDDIVPIVGMSNRKWIPENLGAAEVRLASTDLKKLDSLFQPGTIAGERQPAAMAKFSAS